jgi:hypothetical protein
MPRMAGLLLIVGIVLLITSASTSPEKKIVSGVTAIILFAAIGFFVALTVWLAYKAPAVAPEMIGQAAAYVIILIVFTAIGAGIRKVRLLRNKKKTE